MTARTFTVPAGVTTLTIEVLGGGGRGGAFGGGGGGGGGFARGVYQVTPGLVLNVVLNNTLTEVAPFISATAGDNGFKGSSSQYPGQGGAGGVGTGGNIMNSAGGSGGTGCPGYFGGGGGGAGGMGGNGGNGMNALVFSGTLVIPAASGGAAGGGISGAGGAGATYSNAAYGSYAAGNGTGPGAGGGGGTGNVQGGYNHYGYCHFSWGSCSNPPQPLLSHKPFCEGQSATLQAIGYDTIYWSTDTLFSNLIGTGKLVVTPVLLNYSYVYARSGSCALTARSKLGLSKLPSPSLSVVPSPSVLCARQTCSLQYFGYGNATGYSGNPEMLPYYRSEGEYANYRHRYQFPRDTMLSFKVFVSTYNFCLDTVDFLILFKASPGIVSAASKSTFCAGETVSLSISGKNLTSCLWSTGSPDTVIQVKPVYSSSYTVWYADNNGCTYNDTISLTSKSPFVQVYSDQPILCKGDSATLVALGAYHYTWSTGEKGPVIKVAPEQSTSYVVTGTSEGCKTAAPLVQVVTDCTGLNEENPQKDLRIFPNPSSGEVNVQVDRAAHLQLVNSVGAIIRHLQLEPGETMRLKVPPGIYFLRGDRKTHKLVVLH